MAKSSPLDSLKSKSAPRLPFEQVIKKKKKKKVDTTASPPPSIQKDSLQKQMNANLLALGTIASVGLAVVIGIILRLHKEKWSERSLMYLEFPGEIYLKVLKNISVPLIVASLISALGNLDVKLTGNIGKWAVVYYLSTTLLAIVLGDSMVLIISPGKNVQNATARDVKKPNTTTQDALLDLIRNLFPSNLVEATFRQQLTELKQPENNTTNITDLYQWTIDIDHYVNNANIVGLVGYSIVFGVVISQMKELGKPLFYLLLGLNEIMMTLINFVLPFMPIGVFFLIIPEIISSDDVEKLLISIGWYTLTVVLGILIHGFLILPAIYFVIIRKNPYHFISKMVRALMTAFGTSSSLATLPVTIKCLEKNQVDKRVVRFVVPIGTTINMDGTALYQAVATIFIAQVKGIEMNFVNVVVVSVMATAASIGTVGIPAGSLTTTFMVLKSIGLKPEDIGLVLAIDWLLDRFKTVINVLGDCIGAAIVDHLIQKDLD